MATIIKAIYEDGVFKPQEPVELREHTEVEVSVPDPTSSRALDAPLVAEAGDNGWNAIDRLIGIVDGTPGDVAVNHDHYLYGGPRKQ